MPSDPTPSVPAATVTCPNCNGEGVVSIPWVEYDPRRWATCSVCGGRGKIRNPGPSR